MKEESEDDVVETPAPRFRPPMKKEIEDDDDVVEMPAPRFRRDVRPLMKKEIEGDNDVVETPAPRSRRDVLPPMKEETDQDFKPSADAPVISLLSEDDALMKQETDHDIKPTADALVISLLSEDNAPIKEETDPPSGPARDVPPTTIARHGEPARKRSKKDLRRDQLAKKRYQHNLDLKEQNRLALEQKQYLSAEYVRQPGNEDKRREIKRMNKEAAAAEAKEEAEERRAVQGPPVRLVDRGHTVPEH